MALYSSSNARRRSKYESLPHFPLRPSGPTSSYFILSSRWFEGDWLRDGLRPPFSILRSASDCPQLFGMAPKRDDDGDGREEGCQVDPGSHRHNHSPPQPNNHPTLHKRTDDVTEGRFVEMMHLAFLLGGAAALQPPSQPLNRRSVLLNGAAAAGLTALPASSRYASCVTRGLLATAD